MSPRSSLLFALGALGCTSAAPEVRAPAAAATDVPAARVEPRQRQHLIKALREAATKLTSALSQQPLPQPKLPTRVPRQRAGV